VSREKIREYARATGHDDPRYLEDTGPVVAPPTFATCVTGGRTAEVIGDPELGAHWNLVHGGQAYDFERPLRVGDVLECTPVIADIVDRGRMELMTLKIECTEADSGEPVLTSTSTIIFFTGSEDA
jgi:hypothetical protein